MSNISIKKPICYIITKSQNTHQCSGECKPNIFNLPK